MLLLMRPCKLNGGANSWNSEIETIWISLIGCQYKTSTVYAHISRHGEILHLENEFYCDDAKGRNIYEQKNNNWFWKWGFLNCAFLQFSNLYSMFHRYKTLLSYKSGSMPNLFRHTFMSRIQNLGLFKGLTSRKKDHYNSINLGQKKIEE